MGFFLFLVKKESLSKEPLTVEVGDARGDESGTVRANLHAGGAG